MADDLVIVLGNPIQRDWALEEDAWMTSLSEAFAEAGLTLGSNRTLHMDDDSPTVLQYSIRIDATHETVRAIHLIRTTQGVVPVAVVREEPPPELVAQIVAAVQRSLLNFDAHVGDHPWRALAVLLEADAQSHRSHPRLDASLELDGMHFWPVDRTYLVHGAPQFWGELGGFRRFGPARAIAVSGTARGGHWMSASKVAGRDLRDGLALLSMALDCFCDLKMSPILHEDEAEDWVPEQLVPVGIRKWEADWEWDFESVEAPSWLPLAWRRLQADLSLRSALNAYYEGLRMLERHPSYALLAFMSVLDGIGSLLGAKGTKNRIRAAVDLLGDHETTSRIERIYDSSRTTITHEGLTEGPELYLGAFAMSGFFHEVPAAQFAYGPLALARQVAREVLVKFMWDV